MIRRPPRNGEKRIEILNTLLVDGNALFKTGFFGAKNEYNSNGQHIGGLYQFITSLRKLLTEDLYHRVYVFWDGNFSGKLRYEIYKSYKGDRKDYINGTQPIDESELMQRRLVWDYLNELSIRQIKHEIVESDDLIAYYCLTKKENEKITICSNDRDMCQLISDDIKIYFCDLKHYVDLVNFSQYFCYHQSNSALVKIMIGDDADVIKGISGLGLKTLVSNFPEIAERTVTLTEIIDKARLLREERINKKQKPLKVIDNIINAVTNGVQGNKIYEINKLLVDLKNPFITDDAITELEILKNGFFDDNEMGFKNILYMMKRDGVEDAIGTTRYPGYLIPFKELIKREIKTSII